MIDFVKCGAENLIKMLILAGKTTLYSKRRTLYRNLTIKLVSKPLFRLSARFVYIKHLKCKCLHAITILKSGLELKTLKINFI